MDIIFRIKLSKGEICFSVFILLWEWALLLPPEKRTTRTTDDADDDEDEDEDEDENKPVCLVYCDAPNSALQCTPPINPPTPRTQDYHQFLTSSYALQLCSFPRLTAADAYENS